MAAMDQFAVRYAKSPWRRRPPGARHRSARCGGRSSTATPAAGDKSPGASHTQEFRPAASTLPGPGAAAAPPGEVDGHAAWGDDALRERYREGDDSRSQEAVTGRPGGSAWPMDGARRRPRAAARLANSPSPSPLARARMTCAFARGTVRDKASRWRRCGSPRV